MAKRNTVLDHPAMQDAVKKLNLLGNPTAADYRQAMKEALTGINRDLALEGAPVRSLKEILLRKSLKDLKRYARYHSMKSLGGAGKDELAARLPEAICDAGRLQKEIECMAEEEWAFFTELVKSGTYDKEALPERMIRRLLGGGYVHLFYHEGKIIYALPDEVRAAYDTLEKEPILSFKQVQSALDQFARAAVNLYGAILLEDFARIVNRYAFEGKAGSLEKDLYDIFLDGYDGNEDDYLTWEDYLVSGLFIGDDGRVREKTLKGLLEERKGKPRYQPGPETFLKYADPDYYEVTPQVSALRLALVSFGVDEVTAGRVIDTLHDVIAAEDDPNEMFHVLERYDIVLGPSQMKTVLNLITDMSNHTRLWCNYGHTPDEIYRQRGSGAPRPMGMMGGMMPPMAGVPAGLMEEGGRPLGGESKPATPVMPQGNIPRNGPCPCGSGKKYKHCCGRDQG